MKNINHSIFSKPYKRTAFIALLRQYVLPEDFKEKDEPIEIDCKTAYLRSVCLIGVCASLDLCVLEVRHHSCKDALNKPIKELQNLIYKSGYNHVLGFFLPDNMLGFYRLSVLKQEFNLSGYTVKARYTKNPKMDSIMLPNKRSYDIFKAIFGDGRVSSFSELEKRFVSLYDRPFFKHRQFNNDIDGTDRYYGAKWKKEKDSDDIEVIETNPYKSRYEAIVELDKDHSFSEYSKMIEHEFIKHAYNAFELYFNGEFEWVIDQLSPYVDFINEENAEAQAILAKSYCFLEDYDNFTKSFFHLQKLKGTSAFEYIDSEFKKSLKRWMRYAYQYGLTDEEWYLYIGLHHHFEESSCKWVKRYWYLSHCISYESIDGNEEN